MFEQFSPLDGKRLAALNEKGKLTPPDKKFSILTNEQLLFAHDIMVKTRVADEWAVSLNRQGRMPTYAPNRGQEANSIGALLALKKDDWFVPAFRELGGMLIRDIPLRQYYLYWLGNEMGSHLPIEKHYTMPISVPISSQTLHAVGLSYAEMQKGTDKVALVFVGDGGTSEGDFYEAMNFAAVWNTPTVFFIQNNQWAITTPRETQTKAATLAQKSISCGFEGVQVDGNDLFAVYAATKAAVDKARSGGGPTLIEGVTYRLGAHTTADDPTRYRNDSEVEEWQAFDPLTRLELYLKSKKLITDKKIKEMKEAAKNFAMSEFAEAEKYAPPTLQETVSYTFKEMPATLKEQLDGKQQRREELQQ